MQPRLVRQVWSPGSHGASTVPSLQTCTEPEPGRATQAEPGGQDPAVFGSQKPLGSGAPWQRQPTPNGVRRQTQPSCVVHTESVGEHSEPSRPSEQR